jgi:hypothetical protein
MDQIKGEKINKNSGSSAGNGHPAIALHFCSLLWLIITGTFSFLRSPRLPPLSQIRLPASDAHLPAMADEKLAKLREATAGLTQIRSAAPFRLWITYSQPHERDRDSFVSRL